MSLLAHFSVLTLHQAWSGRQVVGLTPAAEKEATPSPPPRRRQQRKTQDERIECLLAAWKNPSFHQSCALAAWAWLRSYNTSLLPTGPIHHNKPDATTTKRLIFNNDSCIFVYATGKKTELSCREYFTHTNCLFPSRCEHTGCSEQFPLIHPNWVVAVGCGLVRSAETWAQVVQQELSVSHLCHNNNCRNPGHLTLEHIDTNSTRNKYIGELGCRCIEDGRTPVCRTDKHQSQTEARLNAHSVIINAKLATNDLRRCPHYEHEGCQWENPYNTATTEVRDLPQWDNLPGRFPQFWQALNGRPNKLTLIRQAEHLFLHLKEAHKAQ